MISIIEALKTKKILISDGAWGTFLHKKGLASGECPELWNLQRADDIADIAKSYIDAGADIIETNSFGGNAFKLSAYGLSNQVFEINRAAAAISRQAAGKDKIVMGSLGPTGKMLVMGDVTEAELYEAFKEQAIALEAGGADALVIETMTDLDEAKAAIRACKENTACEIICTFTFEKTGENTYHTMMGISPAQMIAGLAGMGLSVIGANCGNGIRDMIGITKEIRMYDKNMPILIHANAGAPQYKDGMTVFPETPAEMAAHIHQLIEAGANIIGGCCGTTPEHISRMVKEVQDPKISNLYTDLNTCKH
jgi:5-methyltetrahydrofolate--homocysteine methyltransferase